MVEIELEVEINLTLDADEFEEIKGYMVGYNESLADLGNLDENFEYALCTYLESEVRTGKQGDIVITNKEITKALKAFITYFGL